MLEIVNEVEIETTVEQAWSVLVDRERYSEWNTVILSQSGELRRGCRGQMRIQPGPGPVLNVSLIYHEVIPQQTLSWFGGPPLIKGFHYFELKALKNGNTLLTHGERFGWLSAILAWPMILGAVKSNYRLADEAFKSRCEALAEVAVMTR